MGFEDVELKPAAVWCTSFNRKKTLDSCPVMGFSNFTKLSGSAGVGPAAAESVPLEKQAKHACRPKPYFSSRQLQASPSPRISQPPIIFNITSSTQIHKR
jgi:hypothetical protein